MSLSGEDDEQTRALAETFGVTRLLDKAEFGRELIPAILQRDKNTNADSGC
jgi:hypothetical protein